MRATISSLSQTVLPAALGGLCSAVGVVAVFCSGAGLLVLGAWNAYRNGDRGAAN